MDIAETTAPKSDQQNYDDYANGPKTVTVAEVRILDEEQPVHIHLVEFPGRPYKPSKSMRRVLVAAWGEKSSTYAGRKMTLYGDPAVKFGGSSVGGIKISHLSHIDGPKTVYLTVTRGKRAPHVVKPLLVDFPEQPEFRTEEQSKRLGALLRGTQREEGLAFISGVINREIDSTQQLTKAEADKVIAALEAKEES